MHLNTKTKQADVGLPFKANPVHSAVNGLIIEIKGC